MSTNAFIGRTKQPTDAELSDALGASKPVWDRLLADLDREHGVSVREWTCHSPKWGWSLRVKRKERTIVWLSPSRRSFQAGFILGDRAMAAAKLVRLPKRVVDAMKSAPKYPEGTGVRLEVKSPRDLGGLKALAAIKLAN